jgi:preprotein translocase subunit SecG
LSFILSVLILSFIIMQKDFALLVVIFLFAINSILMNYYYSKLQKKY